MGHGGIDSTIMPIKAKKRFVQRRHAKNVNELPRLSKNISEILEQATEQVRKSTEEGYYTFSYLIQEPFRREHQTQPSPHELCMCQIGSSRKLKKASCLREQGKCHHTSGYSH